MAEEDVHQRGLAGAVLAEKRDDFALMQGEADVVVGDLGPEALADAFEAQDDGRHAGQDDFGSLSSIFTSKLPSMMAASRSATSFIAASGTLPSKVPKGARELPPLRMKE